METAEISGARIKMVDARSFLIKPIHNDRIGACTKPVNACEYYDARTRPSAVQTGQFKLSRLKLSFHHLQSRVSFSPWIYFLTSADFYH